MGLDACQAAGRNFGSSVIGGNLFMPKYNPNPLFPNEPLFEIHDFSELPKSPRYTLYCNGQEQTVYHTDSFDYAIVVRRDDAPDFRRGLCFGSALKKPFCALSL